MQWLSQEHIEFYPGVYGNSFRWRAKSFDTYFQLEAKNLNFTIKTFFHMATPEDNFVGINAQMPFENDECSSQTPHFPPSYTD